jgi:hypothetical protein
MSTTLIASISQALLFTKTFTGFRNKIADLVIDATDSEIIEYSSIITNHPVSSGSNISDHIYENPILITMEGRITNDSLLGRDFDTLPGFLEGNIVTNIYNYITGPTKKQILAFNCLETLKKNKSLVTIVAKMKTYDNMAIESLNFSRDNEVGDNLCFTIKLKQVNIVTSKIVNITKPIIASKKVGASNLASLGRGDVQKLSSENQQKTKTNLKQNLDRLTNILPSF